MSPGKRSRLALAITLLVLGVACFIGGATLAGGSSPLLGFSIGGAGTVAIVIGAILFRNAMIGRSIDDGQEGKP